MCDESAFVASRSAPQVVVAGVRDDNSVGLEFISQFAQGRLFGMAVQGRYAGLSAVPGLGRGVLRPEFQAEPAGHN